MVILAKLEPVWLLVLKVLGAKKLSNVPAQLALRLLRGARAIRECSFDRGILQLFGATT